MEQREQPGGHYLSFIAMLEQHGRRDVFQRLPEELRESTRTFHERLGFLISHVPEPLRTHRLAQAMIFTVHAAASRAQARPNGQPVLPGAVEATDLIAGTAGVLAP